MRFVNTESKFYLMMTPERCLQDTLKAHKNMYLEALVQQRRKNLPFISPIDELLDVEEELP